MPLAEESQPFTRSLHHLEDSGSPTCHFGICSAPEHFQKKMTSTLNSVPGTTCQKDDEFIFAETGQDHAVYLDGAMKRLCDLGVTPNLNKCEFKVTSVKYLGHVLNANGIHPDPDKLQGLTDFPQCVNGSDVRSFLRIVHKLEKFSPEIATVSKPPRDLLKKDNGWTRAPAQQSMFEELNANLPTDPVLALYSPMHSTMVSSDVSGYGICVVLSQQQPSGEWKPVSYVSRSRTATDVNMLRSRRKALVITWACERFSDYLTGKQFVVKTNHQPLVPLISSTAVDNVLPRVLRFC